MDERSATAMPVQPLSAADYEAIEAAVMETARGRWFLAEYARRHRAADTDAVLAAIGRLEVRLATLAAKPAEATGRAGPTATAAAGVGGTHRAAPPELGDFEAFGPDDADDLIAADATERVRLAAVEELYRAPPQDIAWQGLETLSAALPMEADLLAAEAPPEPVPSADAFHPTEDHMLFFVDDDGPAAAPLTPPKAIPATSRPDVPEPETAATRFDLSRIRDPLRDLPRAERLALFS